MTINELLAEAAKIKGWRIIISDRGLSEVRCNVMGRLHCPLTAVVRMRGKYLNSSGFDVRVVEGILGISGRDIDLIVEAADFSSHPLRQKMLKAFNLEDEQ